MASIACTPAEKILFSWAPTAFSWFSVFRYRFHIQIHFSLCSAVYGNDRTVYRRTILDQLERMICRLPHTCCILYASESESTMMNGARTAVVSLSRPLYSLALHSPWPSLPLLSSSRTASSPWTMAMPEACRRMMQRRRCSHSSVSIDRRGSCTFLVPRHKQQKKTAASCCCCSLTIGLVYCRAMK